VPSFAAMRPVLSDLIDLLALERLEENLFRGESQDLGWGQVFGGQILGQAMSAAEQTVPKDRFCHSLHAYFLRPGDVTRPVIYDVDPIRNGRSFTTRRVVAIQNGKAILNLSASFKIEEDGFDHAAAMPDAPPPESLKTNQELLRELGDRIPHVLRLRADADRPIEIRPVNPGHPLEPEPREPYRQAWFRAADPLPDEPSVHRKLLAYASDFSFMTVSMLPHGISWLTPGMQTASLDHSMWFHRPVHFDEWLLYSVDSPSASNATGLVRGQFFDQQGRLVASTAQEGLIRMRS